MKKYKVTARFLRLYLRLFRLVTIPLQPKRKDEEFISEDELEAKNAFDNFIKEGADEVKLIKINEKGDEEIIQAYLVSTTTSSTTT